MFFYLARNPEVQAKVAAEVRAAFSSSAEVRAGPALHGCRYLKAFIQEACRMTPPVAAEPSREVLPGGAQVGGHVFPAGTLLSTGLYALSYNADVYPEPFAFRPERWLPEHATADAIALAESGFCAFSAGSRGCPGKNLAMMEMTLVMAKLVWAYELRQDQSNLLGGGGRAGLGDKMRKGRECEGQFQIFDAFVAVRHGPMVQFKKRE
jgi:cytochrome P450